MVPSHTSGRLCTAAEEQPDASRQFATGGIRKTTHGYRPQGYGYPKATAIREQAESSRSSRRLPAKHSSPRRAPVDARPPKHARHGELALTRSPGEEARTGWRSRQPVRRPAPGVGVHVNVALAEFRSRRSSRREGRPTRVTGILRVCRVELPALLPHLASVLVASVDELGPAAVVHARRRPGVPACMYGLRKAERVGVTATMSDNSTTRTGCCTSTALISGGLNGAGQGGPGR